jgi:hypothetical protein
MGLKLLSKNNMGLVATLILLILLSQSRFFDFLTETPLGRMILLAFIILITYTNKIFGLLAVLFIICAFKKNDFGFVQNYNYEGFNVENMMEEEDLTKGTDSTKEKEKLKIEYDSNKMDLVEPKVDSSQIATITSSSVSSNAREGFCMSDRELNILRGKQSNTVHVFNKSREQNNEIEAADKSVFSSDYALF